MCLRADSSGTLKKSFSPAASPVSQPVQEGSHRQHHTEPGHLSHNMAGIKVFGQKIKTDVVVDEQEQNETDQDTNNSHERTTESSNGARFVVLAQGESHLALRLT